MAIQFQCPVCQKRYAVKDEMAGKKAKCKCGELIPIVASVQATTSKAGPTDQRSSGVHQNSTAKPAASGTANAVTKNSGNAKAGVTGKTSATAKGNVAAKPAVAKAITPQPEVTAPDPDPLFGDTFGDASGDAFGSPNGSLFSDEELAALQGPVSTPSFLTSPAAAGSLCPSCQKPLLIGSSICANCGTNIRLGEKIPSQPRRSTSASGSASSGLAAIPSLLLGTIFSFIGSCIGAAMWAVVAVVLQVEIGWIAWGLGVLAGFGMARGHDDDDGTLAGIIAAGMSLVGIGIAKVAIFLAVLLPILRELDAEFTAASPQLFFSVMFSPIDSLFIFLAVASAYKVGSGTNSDD